MFKKPPYAFKQLNLKSLDKSISFHNFHIVTLRGRVVARESWFQIATVLVHVCKLLVVAGHGEIVFETLGAPNVTHAMVSACFLHRRCSPRLISCASGRPSRTLTDRQTLRVCSEIVRGPFEHLCRAACRLAKRYVCTASAFPAVETSHGSSIWTR